MLPAFHDAHTHPVWGGLSHAGCNLYDGNSPEDYQKIVAKCAADEPGDGWIYGSGWKDGLFPPDGVPDKKLLDAVVSNRPVAFTNVGGHGIWVNSKALEVAGITRNTERSAEWSHRPRQEGRADRFVPGSGGQVDRR